MFSCIITNPHPTNHNNFLVPSFGWHSSSIYASSQIMSLPQPTGGSLGRPAGRQSAARQAPRQAATRLPPAEAAGQLHALRRCRLVRSRAWASRGRGRGPALQLDSGSTGRPWKSQALAGRDGPAGAGQSLKRALLTPQLRWRIRMIGARAGLRRGSAHVHGEPRAPRRGPALRA